MADTQTVTWGIGGRTKTVAVTRTLDASGGNYAANDVVSDDDTASGGTAITFDKIAKGLGGAGYITNASILCSATSVVWRLRLYLYHTTPTSGELDDNAANTSPHTSDRAKYTGHYIDFPAMSTKGGNAETQVTTSTVGDLPISFNCDSDDDALYGILVTLDAETNEASGMTIVISLTSEIQ